jgi:hypothetical protein
VKSKIESENNESESEVAAINERRSNDRENINVMAAIISISAEK